MTENRVKILLKNYIRSRDSGEGVNCVGGYGMVKTLFSYQMGQERYERRF